MSISAARITWTASALTTTWYRYIVERERPDGDWEAIAHIYTKATTTFDDYAARRGVDETYRVKQEDTNGITSVASAEATVTVPGGRHYIVSNHDPTLNVELAIAPGHEFTLGAAVNAAATNVAGGGNRLMWGEETGDTIAWVAQMFSATNLGPAQWAAYVDLMRAQASGAIPHVTVLDAWGNRYEAGFVMRSATLARGTRADGAAEIVAFDNPVPVEVP